MSTTLTILLALTQFDAIATVRSDLALPKDANFLTMHDAQIAPFDLLGAPQASYAKFFEGAGPKPVRFSFAADIDGDGRDEIVVIREVVAKNRLLLEVVDPPQNLHQKKQKVLASFQSSKLPKATGDGALIAAGRIDLEGDGRDEFVFGRSYLDGHFAFEILRAPQKKQQKPGAPLASADLGPLAEGVQLRAAFGGRSVASRGEDLLIVTVDGAGKHRLSAHAMPSAAGVLSDPIFVLESLEVAATELEEISVARGSGGFSDRLLILRRLGPTTQRIEIRPLVASTSLGSTVIVEDSTTSNAPIRHAISLRGVGISGSPTQIARIAFRKFQPDGSALEVVVPDLPAAGSYGAWAVPLPSSGEVVIFGLDQTTAPNSFAFDFLSTAGEPMRATITPGFSFIQSLAMNGSMLTSDFTGIGWPGAVVENLTTGAAFTPDLFSVWIVPSP